MRHRLLTGLLALLSVASLGAASERGLTDAVKRGDVAMVHALIGQRVDVNAPETDGTTALHWAAERDDAEIVGLLIRAGADVKAANRYGVTPLSRACINGSAAVIEMLLKAGADPDATLPDGETAVMTAARTGKVDALRVLIRSGADVNAKESRGGQTALVWAAAEGHGAAAAALIEAGADVHQRLKDGFTPLLFAVREGRIDTVRTLLKMGARVDETLTVRTAPNTEQPMIVRSQRTVSPLILAVQNAHYELAAVLLDAGADPNADADGWTALHELTWARRAGSGSNEGPVGSGTMSSLELVKRLVAHGAPVNGRMTRQAPVRTDLNMVGATPFLLAARFADPELMRLLLTLGADPLLPNDDNTTPLMVAAGVGVYSPSEDPGTESEVLEATRLALELGGDVNAVDKNGETAMHGAAYMGANSVVQFLVDKGARIEIWNQQNKSEWTPLQIAQGVYRTGSLRAMPQTVPLLRQLMGHRALENAASTDQKISTAATSEPAEEKQVLATLEATTRAINQFDLKTLRRVYHPDLAASRSDAPTLTRDAAIRAINERLGDQRSRVSSTNTTVHVVGSVALVRNVVTEEFYVDALMPSATFDVLWVLVKGEGPHGWQILVRQATRRPEGEIAGSGKRP